jgi:hypothetical protein
VGNRIPKALAALIVLNVLIVSYQNCGNKDPFASYVQRNSSESTTTYSSVFAGFEGTGQSITIIPSNPHTVYALYRNTGSHMWLKTQEKLLLQFVQGGEKFATYSGATLVADTSPGETAKIAVGLRAGQITSCVEVGVQFAMGSGDSYFGEISPVVPFRVCPN